MCVLTSLIIWLWQEDREAQEVEETKTERRDVLLHGKQSDSNAKVHIILLYLLTYNKATLRANHVPCSVVLHQDGIWVVGTLNSGKGQSISAKRKKNTDKRSNHSKEKIRTEKWRQTNAAGEERVYVDVRTQNKFLS